MTNKAVFEVCAENSDWYVSVWTGNPSGVAFVAAGHGYDFESAELGPDALRAMAAALIGAADVIEAAADLVAAVPEGKPEQ